MTIEMEATTSRVQPVRPRASRAPVVLLGAAALAWTAGQAALPDMGKTFAERFDAVAAARGRESLSTVLLFAAGCLLVTSALSLGRLPSSRTARVVVVLTGLGGVWLCAGRAAFNLQMLMATDLDKEQGLAFLEASAGTAFAPFPLTLLALLVGPALLAVAARRAGRSSWLPLVLWVVGIGVFIGSEFTVKPLEVVGVAAATSGLVLAGRALTDPEELPVR